MNSTIPSIRSLFHRGRLWLMVLLPFFLVQQLGMSQGNEQGTLIEGFSIPEYNQAGELERKVIGDRAIVPVDPDQPVITLEGLKIELYEDAKVRATVTADACKYDRERRFVRSKSEVNIKSEEMEISGKEFAFDGVRERFVIFKNAKVRLLNMDLVLTKPDADKPDADKTD